MTWLGNARKATRKFEGTVTHMYLDTKGFVTVGVGHLLKAKGDAARLPFVKREGGKKATKKEIADEWTTVKKLTKGRAARFYEKHTTLDISTTVATSLLDRKLKEFESGMKRIYPNFAKLPDGIKEGLMDIAYNTGIGGLRKFKKMKAAIDEGDYSKAAKESKRPGGRAERNNYVRNLFMKVHKANPGKKK